MMTDKQPAGNLVIRTLAMPADTNANGDIFGGWLVSQMDLGGAILANQTSRSRVVTVAIDKMIFLQPVNVGDTVCCYANLTKIGNTSMTIGIEVWAVPYGQTQRHQVTDGIFTYVAVDENRRPIPVKRED